MALFYVDLGWKEPTLEKRIVTKSTACFHYLDKSGLHYSRRITKESIGQSYFASAQDAINNFVALKAASVQDAKDMVESRTIALNKAEEWARLKLAEVGEQPTTAQGEKAAQA
jgi:hypothetical protein